MPMYEYACEACHKVFEELVFGSPEAVPCPKCGSPRTKRLLSASCVRGSGKGFGGGADFAPSAPASGCGGGGRFT